MPAVIPLIISAIQAAIAAAPQVAKVVAGAKAWISSLFAGGIITAEQQDALHAHVDSIAALNATGIRPAAWTVEPDPQ
jgi:hypothetical protein